MLYFSRIEVSEGIDVNKTTEANELYLPLLVFLNKVFKFQPNVCNGYHDLLMMSCSILLFQTLKGLIMAVLLVELAKLRP